MKRVVACVALALCSCRYQPDAPVQKSEQPVGAVLVLHWKDGQAVFSREYGSMDACQAAMSIILDDNAKRTKINADTANRLKSAPDAESIPDPTCFPA